MPTKLEGVVKALKVGLIVENFVSGFPRKKEYYDRYSLFT